MMLQKGKVVSQAERIVSGTQVVYERGEGSDYVGSEIEVLV